MSKLLQFAGNQVTKCGSLITSVSFSKMVWNELIIKVKARNGNVYSKENSFDCSKEKP